MDAKSSRLADSLKRAKQMRRRNDTFRRDMPHGSVIISRSVGQVFDNDQLRAITQLIRQYDEFGSSDDPDEWHDHGVVEFGSEKLVWQIGIWKIDHDVPQDDTADERDVCRMLHISLNRD